MHFNSKIRISERKRNVGLDFIHIDDVIWAFITECTKKLFDWNREAKGQNHFHRASNKQENEC